MGRLEAPTLIGGDFDGPSPNQFLVIKVDHHRGSGGARLPNDRGISQGLVRGAIDGVPWSKALAEPR